MLYYSSLAINFKGLRLIPYFYPIHGHLLGKAHNREQQVMLDDQENLYSKGKSNVILSTRS